MERAAPSEPPSAGLDVELGELDLGELEPVAGEAARKPEAERGGEVVEDEVLAASSEIDLSDLEEDLSLEEVLEQVAAAEPQAEEKPATELQEPTEADVLEATVSLEVDALEEVQPPLPKAPVEEEAPAEKAESAAKGKVSLDLEDLEKELEIQEADAVPQEKPSKVERRISLDEGLIKEIGVVRKPAAPEEGRKEERELLGAEFAEITEKPEEEPKPEGEAAGIRIAGIESLKLDETEAGKEKPRKGLTVDLSALEDLEILEVEGVKEEPEPAEEKKGKPEASSAEEKFRFELDEDWPSKKEDEEKEKPE